MALDINVGIITIWLRSLKEYEFMVNFIGAIMFAPILYGVAIVILQSLFMHILPHNFAILTLSEPPNGGFAQFSMINGLLYLSITSVANEIIWYSGANSYRPDTPSYCRC